MLVGGAMICSLAACGGQSSSAPASTAAPTEKTADTTAAEAGDTTEAGGRSGRGQRRGQGLCDRLQQLLQRQYIPSGHGRLFKGGRRGASEDRRGQRGDLCRVQPEQQHQVQQIENFILQGVDAIIIDPGSATALNGAIQELPTPESPVSSSTTAR